MKTRRVALILIVGACLAITGRGLRAAETAVADLLGGLKSSDAAVRLQTIDKLGALGPKAAEAVTPLTEVFKDRSPKVRAHALWALGSIGAAAKPAVPAMAELLKDPDAHVRGQVVKAVMAIRPGPQVTVPLCVKLLDDPDAAVRARVLQAIADAGEKAVPGLIEALKNEKAAYWACVLLREIGPAAKDAVPALAEKIKDPRPQIRREAVLALGAMNEAAAAAVPQIAAALTDAHSRTAATFVLGQLGQIPADAEATVRANAKAADPLLATVSLWALARVHPEDKTLHRQTGEQLVARLKDKDAFVRVAAARGLAALPPAPEIMGPIWEKAMQGADETTVQHALDAFAQLGGAAVPRLVEALKHEKMRPQLIYILGQIGPAAAPATDALAKLINDKNPRVADEAILALGKIGAAAKSAVPALLKTLQSPTELEANRASIAFALGKIGPDAAEAQPALDAALKNSDRSLALMAAWALNQIQPGGEIAAKTVPVLIEGLALPVPECRQLAAEALGRLGAAAKAAATALEQATHDEDRDVRNAAAAALTAVGGPAPKTSAAEAAAIKNGDVVLAADDDVPLKAGNDTVARLAKGTPLKVLEVRAPWVAVKVKIDNESKIGWVLQKQVIKP
jgi:HEAT repeat protein